MNNISDKGKYNNFCHNKIKYYIFFLNSHKLLTPYGVSTIMVLFCSYDIAFIFSAYIHKNMHA